MGGLLILGTLFVSVLIFCRWTNEILLLLGVSLSFGAIGFYDDYFKLVKKNHHGLAGRKKIFFQSLIGLAMGLVLFKSLRFANAY